jgi:single-stranded-DNA-specific exonuclease
VSAQTVQGAKYLWRVPDDDRLRVLDIAHKYSISFPVAQTLIERGYTTPQAIDAFLFTSLERDVAHASSMKDADRAVDRLLYAVDHGQKILICGDYDVDGVTSSSVMLTCMLPLGAQINFFLPHRVKDGYGLSVKTVERAAANGYKLLITVDNGITAFAAAERARELGIDLIITDHHRPHDHVPDAFAIVNPNQVDCPYPFKKLAGVGVSFKLMSLLYERKGLTLPEKVYELLMLGTVADVVPLQGENRYWVRHGLSYVNRVESYAFKILKQNGKVTKSIITSTDVGFSIAPQINALGRLEDARDAVKFLIGSDYHDTEKVGRILLELNEARKEVERGITAQVMKQVESGTIDLTRENIIMAASDAWPPGVIGLVASRLVSAFGKPTLLFHIGKDGIAKGSCRSIAEFNMFDALVENSALMKNFGGHSQAAGLALPATSLGTLKANLERRIAELCSPDDLKLKLKLDAQATLPDVHHKLVADMHHLEPFGNENSQPAFYFKDLVMVQQPQLLKGAHVKCMLFADGVVKPIIFFNRPELYALLQEHGERPLHVAAHISENHWNGKVSVELSGIDIALAGE